LISGLLSRAGARAARGGKCWRFHPPSDPLQAALRLAPLIIPMFDFIQSARDYSKRLWLTPRASTAAARRLLLRCSRHLPRRAAHHPIGVCDAREPRHVFALRDAQHRQQPALVGAVRFPGRRQGELPELPLGLFQAAPDRFVFDGLGLSLQRAGLVGERGGRPVCAGVSPRRRAAS